jgi:two-component system, NtrC family, response regulator AtoC
MHQPAATNAIETARLLLVSGGPAVLRPLCSIAESNFWHLEIASNGWDAIERLQAGAVPDLLLLELPGTDSDVLHVLRWLHRLRPDLPIILICYMDDAERKEEAIRLGAQEILLQPLEEHELELAIRRNLSSAPSGAESNIRSEDAELLGDGTFFVGASPVMRKLRAQVKLLAQAQVPVLILGESGSGKTATAQLIHELSVGYGQKLLKVNCAALPAHLLEEELFGSDGETRFAQARAGKLELCGNGTLLVDEIVEMPPHLQDNLVRVLQSRQLARQGGDKLIEVDVRILAATSANIEHAVAARRFREDLYHYLSAFTLHVPPLRQRKEEVPLLLHYFMLQLARHYSLPPRTFSPAVVEACQRYSWPGNLKELQGFVKRYLLMQDNEFAFDQKPVLGEMAEAGDAFSSLTAPLIPAATNSEELGYAPDSLKSLLQSVKLKTEKNAIAVALQKTGWNRKAAARMLKVSYRTVLYKIEQYHLRPSTATQFPEEQIVPGNGNPFKGGR